MKKQKTKSLPDRNKEAVNTLYDLLFGSKKHLSAKEKMQEMQRVTPIKITNKKEK